MSWTPITEKMPPAGKLVLLKQQAENWEPFVIIGKFVPAKTEEDDGPDSDFTEACDYDEEKEVWYWPEGFYERIANWDESGSCSAKPLRQSSNGWRFLSDKRRHQHSTDEHIRCPDHHSVVWCGRR